MRAQPALGLKAGLRGNAVDCSRRVYTMDASTLGEGRRVMNAIEPSTLAEADRRRKTLLPMTVGLDVTSSAGQICEIRVIDAY